MIFSVPPVRAQTNKKTVVVSAFRDAMALPPLRPHLDYGDPRNPAAAVVSVGSALGYTITEVQARAEPTNSGIQALDKDVRANLVFANPVDLRAAADEADSLANGDVAKTIGQWYVDSLHAAAQNYRADADALDLREKSLSPDQINQQIHFSQSWFDFKSKWDAEYQAVHNPPFADLTFWASGHAATIDSIDAQYRNSFLPQYQALSGKKASFVPDKSNAGDVLPPGTVSAVGDTLGFVVKTLAIGAVVVGGVLVVPPILASMRRPASAT